MLITVLLDYKKGLKKNLSIDFSSIPFAYTKILLISYSAESFDFVSGTALLSLCEEQQISISEAMMERET